MIDLLRGWAADTASLWHDYAPVVIVAGLVLGLVILLGLVIYVKVTHRKVKPTLIFIGTNLALLLNAEGMWEVLVEKAKVPPAFAVLVFAIFEIALLIVMDLAKQRYVATTVRDSEGKVLRAGDPGFALTLVWFIALSSGLVVATNSDNVTVFLLRLLVPVMVVLMWWAVLTAEGRTKTRSRFVYSPQRLVERWGWFDAERDVTHEKAVYDRRVRLLVTYSHRLYGGSKLNPIAKRRYIALARVATEEMLAEAEEQIRRTISVRARLVPFNPVLAKDAAAAAGGPVDELAVEAAVPVSAPAVGAAVEPVERVSLLPECQPSALPVGQWDAAVPAGGQSVSALRGGVLVPEMFPIERPAGTGPIVLGPGREYDQAWVSALQEQTIRLCREMRHSEIKSFIAGRCSSGKCGADRATRLGEAAGVLASRVNGHGVAAPSGPE